MNNKKKIGLILGLMCMLLSYGIAAQIKMTNSTGSTMSTNATENELRNAVLKSKEKYDNLYLALEEAEKKLESERANATKNNGELTDLENSIKEGNKVLGLTEVTGDGVKVILNDNQKIPSNSYFGDLNDLLIHYNDVIRIVNELKNAGAEAISVNDQRIVTTSAIECVGNVIKINGVKVGVPFEIKAIGFPAYMIGALDRKGGYLENLRNYELVAEIKKEENLTIPKYTGVIKFDYATSK